MTSPSLTACPCGTTGPCANPNCHVRTGRLPGGTRMVDTCDDCARHNVGPCPHVSPARSILLRASRMPHVFDIVEVWRAINELAALRSMVEDK